MSEASEFAATFCCGLFFGAALYVSVVQHPAARETGVDFASRFFGPMYRRAAALQASLASIGFLAGLAAWWSTAGRLWLAAALLLVASVPFTLLVVKPVNDALLAGDRPIEERRALLARWGRLHWMRTIAAGLAFAASVFALLRRE
ncbi:MAG TPA: DUF1772 domain-containing protein [Candidatus Binatia bacterium]|nr:DUF1772 domain-containing protein [Candidatus Binatia bacterium]